MWVSDTDVGLGGDLLIHAEVLERAQRGPGDGDAGAERAPVGVDVDQLRERFPKIAKLMDGAEDDVLAHMSFPNEASIYHLMCALLLEQNDEWALQRR